MPFILERGYALGSADRKKGFPVVLEEEV